MILATHQIEEVQHVLTDVVYLDRGRIVFSRSVEDLESQYHELFVHPDRLAAARALHPISERQGVGQSVLIFEGADRLQLAVFGDVRTPSIDDLFVAVMSRSQGAAQ